MTALGRQDGIVEKLGGPGALPPLNARHGNFGPTRQVSVQDGSRRLDPIPHDCGDLGIRRARLRYEPDRRRRKSRRCSAGNPTRFRVTSQAPAYVCEVKTPAESKSAWSLYKLRATAPGEQAFRPPADGHSFKLGANAPRRRGLG